MKLEDRKIIRLYQHTDRELITYTNKAIENNDIEIINAVIRIIKEFRKQTPKTIEFGNEIISNIANTIKGKSFFNEQLELEEEYKLLTGYEEILIKNICSKNYTFTEKQISYIPNKIILFVLDNYKDDKETTNNILKEINARLSKNNFEFTSQSADHIYNFIYLLNKYNYIKELEKLIKDDKFLKMLDNSQIPGSLILSSVKSCSLTSKKKLLECKKIKNSLKGKDPLFDSNSIISELTKEEINVIFKDMSIANYIISNGICFDLIPDIRKRQITEEIENLNLYSTKTIVELTNGHPDIKTLANNIDYVFKYLTKIDNQNYEHRLLQYINENTISEIIADKRFNKLKTSGIKMLIKYTTEDIKKILLKQEKVIFTISNNFDKNIVNIIPEFLIKELLIKNDKNLSYKEFEIINELPKKDIKYIFENKTNSFENLINVLKKENDIKLSNVINGLPEKYLKELSFIRIYDLNVNAINNLILANKAYFRNSLLEQDELVISILNNLNKNNVNVFIELLTNANYKDKELLNIVDKFNLIKDSYVLTHLFHNMSREIRERLFDVTEIREKLLNNNKLQLEDFIVNYLITHQKEIINISSSLIIKLLKQIEPKVRKKIISNSQIITKLLESEISVLNLIKLDISYLSELTKNEYIKYYNKQNFQEIYNYLPYEHKIELCNNNKLIKHIIDDENIYKIYQNLILKDKKILNTLNFNFLNKTTSKMKLNHLLIMAKSQKLQQLYLSINEKYDLSSSFMTNLINNLNDLEIEKTLYELLLIINKSVQGENRKQIGNIPNLIQDKELSCTEFKKLVEYLLYFIPRFNLISRPKVKETPSNYQELKDYTNNYDNKLDILIKDSQGLKLKDYFLIKHYKLTYNEAKELIKNYSVERIDEKIYSEELKFYFEVKNIFNKPDDELRKLDSKTKNMTMIESLTIEYKLKKLYTKIYNYELMKNSKSTRKTTLNLFGKNIDIYNSSEDFIYLISDINLKKEYKDNYKEAWNNKLNKLSFINVNLLSNDNLYIQNKKEILFGFNKIGAIFDIDPYLYINSETKYQTPRELLDNTRYSKNEILIDKYIDSNYIEPNYIIIFEDILYQGEEINTSYLNQAYQASIDFKSKNNPKGLPIIVISVAKVKENEINKINYNLNRYIKNHDVALLSSTLTRLNNNYNAYLFNNKSALSEFASITIEDIIHTRIKNSNSISELEYIKSIIELEQKKYKEYKCHINYKTIIKSIINRINKLK